jgi:hypothetical protein
MNIALISGRIQAIAVTGPRERVLLVDTSEAPSQCVLIKYAGALPLTAGDWVETIGQLKTEAVVVAGETLTTQDGRVAHRSVFYANVVTVIAGATMQTAVEGREVKTVPLAQPVTVKSRPARKEVAHVRVPEIPWE